MDVVGTDASLRFEMNAKFMAFVLENEQRTKKE